MPKTKLKKSRLQDDHEETEEERKAREAREGNLQEEETEEERIAREAREKEEEDSKLTARLTRMEEDLISVKSDLLRAIEENEGLRAKLSNAKVDKNKEAAMIENKRLREDIFAFKIRAVVEHGLRTATLKAAWCENYAGNGPVDTTGTLQWLKSSRFYDPTLSSPRETAFRLLKFTAEKGDVLYKVNQTFRSGQPLAGSGELTLSEDDRKNIRKRGMSPEKVIAGAKAQNFADYKELTAGEEK